jgi:O-antigen/teichoic acid export membrane protein
MALRRNTTYNVAGLILPLAVSLVTIPLYLQLIGEARYGVLAIVWLLLGYFGLFDFGFGRATAHGIASDSQHSDAAARWQQTFWTALLINLALGVVGAVLICLCAYLLFADVLTIAEALRPEIDAAIPWLGLALPVATASGVLSGALQGREKFLALNMVSVMGTLLFQVLPLLVAALWSVRLDVLIPAAVLARLITIAVLLLQCRRHVISSYKPAYSAQRARQLFSFGGWVMVTALVGPMMVILDRFVVGAIAGAKAVSHYTVPFQLAENSTLIPAALGSALFPRLTAISTVEQRHLTYNALQVIACVMTPLFVGGILLIELFFNWWISPEFSSASANLGRILLAGFFFNCFAKIPYALLQARGRPDLVARTHLAELLPYLVLLYLGTNSFGVAGAAVAFCIRVIADYLILSFLAGTLAPSAQLLPVPSALVGIAMAVSITLPAAGYLWLASAGGLVALTLLWSALVAPQNLREYALSVATITGKFLAKTVGDKDIAKGK